MQLSDLPGWSEVASYLPVTGGQVKHLVSLLRTLSIHCRIRYFYWLYYTSALANKDSELTPPATSTPDHVSFLKRLQPCWPSRGTSMSSSLKHGKKILKELFNRSKLHLEDCPEVKLYSRAWEAEAAEPPSRTICSSLIYKCVLIMDHLQPPLHFVPQVSHRLV